MKSFSLTDHFLIAMPSLADSLFEHAVVYLCEHTERGAMGVVVNRPSDMTLSTLFEQVHCPWAVRRLVVRRFIWGGLCKRTGALCCTSRWGSGNPL